MKDSKQNTQDYVSSSSSRIRRLPLGHFKKEKIIMDKSNISKSTSFKKIYRSDSINFASRNLLMNNNSASSLALDSDLGDSCGSETDSSMPVLLSVRKRTCSDSIQESQPNQIDKDPKAVATVDNNNSKKKPHRKSSGIFRLFYRSAATLLFNHPTTELNPDKPYKGVIFSQNTYNHRSDEFDYHHYVVPTLSVNKNPPQQMPRRRLASSNTSKSQFSSSSNPSSVNSSPFHRRRLNHEFDDEVGKAKKNIHSSSNSVISSGRESSSSDSGAFSRTSSPEIVTPAKPRFIQASRPISKAKSTLELKAPLSAPSLVMEACGLIQNRRKPLWNREDRRLSQDHYGVDTKHILACLDAASESSSMNYYGLLHPEDYRSINDVSVTIGTNTKLTISPSYLYKRSNLRRTRSGLPLLGTSCLMLSKSTSDIYTTSTLGHGSYKPKSPSPIKPFRNTRNPVIENSQAKKNLFNCSQNNNVSTIYVESQEHSLDVNNKKNCCSEKVTVNGQHHCGKTIFLNY